MHGCADAKYLLTKRVLQEAEADQGTAEGEEGFVDVSAPLVANDEALHLVQPGEGPSDDPPVAA